MSKTMLKKIFAVMLALTMMLALVFTTSCSLFGGDDDDDNGGKGDKNAADESFVDELGGVSETFEGAVSAESYASANEAAQEFVKNEIAGEATASISSVQAVKTFTPSNVDIEIPADILAGADSIEKLEVTYELYEGSAYGLASSSSSQKTVVVYVIKIELNYKYYTPAPITGETITKTYYDSVFNAEKYENCTFESTITADASVEASGQGVSMTMTMDMSVTQLIKHSDGKVYLEQITSVTSVMSYNGQSETESQNTSIYAYIEEVDGNIVCYVKQNANDNWMRGSLYTIGFSSVEELRPFYDQYLDYSYFTKTNYGFALEDENAQQYFNQAFADIMSQLGAMLDMDNMEVDMTAKYYVSEGVLSGVQTDADVAISMNESGVSMTLDETVNAVTTCKNYGTTVIERPNVD